VAFRPGGNTSAGASQDGRLLAGAGHDRTVTLWDPDSGRERATLKGHADDVASGAFSPDGLTLASAGGDGTMELWDVTSGEQRATLRGHTAAITLPVRNPPRNLSSPARSENRERRA
jgi:WD40 repeat protein